MAEKLDPKEMVTQKELVYSSMMQIEAITRLLLKKGIITINEESGVVTGIKAKALGQKLIY